MARTKFSNTRGPRLVPRNRPEPWAAGTAAGLKKNGAAKRPKRGPFQTYIHKVFRHVLPNYELSKKGMNVMNSCVEDLFEKFADEASRLCLLGKRKTLTVRDIKSAVRLLLSHGKLLAGAVDAAEKALAKFAAAYSKKQKSRSNRGSN